MKLSTLSVSAIVVLVILLITTIVLWPIAIIAALNTLFPLLSIPYSFITWLSVVVLNISTFGGLQMTIKNLNK